MLAVKITRGRRPIVDRTFVGRVRIKLDTRRLATYVIRAAVDAERRLRPPRTRPAGHTWCCRASRWEPASSAVAQLGDQLRRLHYAAPYGATFDGRMLDAVYAFQKVQGLPRTGAVDARFWQALGNRAAPIPRYAPPASHLEVDKGRQVLYVVRGAKSPWSCRSPLPGWPATFTPVGRFAIYRKVGGFDPSPLGTLYDPMYFTGGYAIHGNPSVPPYPASHGCVRVPMWVAPHLYATNPYGETVYVY